VRHALRRVPEGTGNTPLTHSCLAVVTFALSRSYIASDNDPPEVRHAPSLCFCSPPSRSLLRPPSARGGRQNPTPAAEAAASSAGLETAVLAGGCFWGVQAVYQHVKGVSNAVSGYAGGAKTEADYGMVSSGRTGHAEAVAVTSIRARFPTARFCRSTSRSRTTRPSSTTRGPITARSTARRFSRKTTRRRRSPRITSRSSTPRTLSRRDCHQDRHDEGCVLSRRSLSPGLRDAEPAQPYIVFNDAPKVVNLKALFADVWRDEPRLTSEAARTQ